MIYVVIDDTGNASYGFENKAAEKRGDATPQQFDREALAIKRGKQLAKSAPGEVIAVYRLVKTICCEIGEPEVVDQ